MKFLCLALAIILGGPASHALAPVSCDPNDSAIAQSGSQVDAYSLLEKIDFLGPKNILNNGQYEQFTQSIALARKRLGAPTEQRVEIRHLCDFFSQQAAIDPRLKGMTGPLMQHAVSIKVKFPDKLRGDRSNNVAIFTSIALKGRVITGQCDDLFKCQSVYQFYVDEVSTMIERGYQVGGFSSAGGN